MTSSFNVLPIGSKLPIGRDMLQFTGRSHVTGSECMLLETSKALESVWYFEKLQSSTIDRTNLLQFTKQNHFQDRNVEYKEPASLLESA